MNNNSHPKRRGNSERPTVSNNDMLYQQICTSITTDHHDKLLSNLENGRGEIEYHVRDGQLQKRRHIDVSDLLDSDETFFTGMSRENIKNFLLLIERKLKRKSAIDYGAIHIRFEISSSGDFEVCQLSIIRENHFARY